MSKPVDQMTDEEFNAAFEAMRNEPVGDEPMQDESSVEEETVANDSPDTEGEEETEEQSEEEEESATEGEEGTTLEVEEEEESEDSEVTQKGYDFSKVPMDELLPIDIPANGIKVKATMNELIEGFKKGMNYTQKMQEISQHRKSISILAEHGLNEKDLGLLIDARSGNKEAIAKLLRDAKVDPLDLDVESKTEYVAKDYSKDEVDPEMEYVRKEILSDTEYAPIVEDAIKTMPEDMFREVAGNANNLSALYKDVKSGVYQRVMPEVIKIKNLYGSTKSTKDLYIEVARNMAPAKVQPNVAPVPSKEETESKKQELNDKKKKAVSSSAAVSKPSVIKQDLDELDDDAFAKEFAKITGRSINEFK